MRSLSVLAAAGLFCVLTAAAPAATSTCPCPTVRTHVRTIRSARILPASRVHRYGDAARTVEESTVRPEFTVPSGTRIPVRLGQTLDTKYDKVGAPFVAYVAAPVVLRNGVVLPRGARCDGHLVESKASGRLKGRAKMGLSLDSIDFKGRRYAVATSDPLLVGKNHKAHDAAWIGGGAGGGAAIGAIAGEGVGAAVGAGAGALAGTVGAVVSGKKNLRVPSETRLDFTLRQPVRLRV